MCISNEVGGDLWGNGYWRGVKLGWLLDQAGIKPGVVDAMFSAADDYHDSVPLANATNPDALLAWELNGAPLTKAHGFPARLLIPSIYGMKNVKWLTGITLVDHDFLGYWQTRGWDDTAHYQTASRFDVPAPISSPPAGPLELGGVAFAGDRGIQKVEVTLDQGRTWQPATVKPGLSRNTWQLWRATVTVDQSVKAIQVRATDGTGVTQTQQDADPFPSGSTGYHTINVSVT
jgi:hypothetical protein